MCYSAQASFIAATYLTTIGILCIKKNKIKHAILFACIPVVFALQQISEGLLWMSFPRDWPMIQSITPYIFLLFAFFVWPIYIPTSIAFLEKKSLRKKHLILLSMLGIIVSLYLYSYIALYGASAEALNCHIYYNVSIPASENKIGTLLYLLTTVAPFFVSSLSYMHIFGFVLLLSYIISYQFYFIHLISIWCFFAAVLSSLAYVIIVQLNNKKS
ncbi:MAG: DUF6629 family protein [Candidatus Dependentiae bacterium]